MNQMDRNSGCQSIKREEVKMNGKDNYYSKKEKSFNAIFNFGKKGSKEVTKDMLNHFNYLKTNNLDIVLS